MNILFFLIPKEKVEYIYNDFTVRQTMEKMELNRYTAIPMINREGEYIGTISEGDILMTIKNTEDFNIKIAEKLRIQDVCRIRDNEPISVNARIGDLIDKIINQNFVPVVDDRNKFIGIVTRKDIIQYLVDNQKE